MSVKHLIKQFGGMKPVTETIDKEGDNQEGFQEVLLNDDDESINANVPITKFPASKRSMLTKLLLTDQSNVDNDDSFKSLTPVNEMQSFVPNEISITASLRTSFSLTSDSSTPKLETRKLSNTYSGNPTKSYLKKSSTSNTLKDDNDDSDEPNRPKLKKQEKFCYSKFDDAVVGGCQCTECFEIRDRASFFGGEISPSNLTSINQNKFDQTDSDFGRQSSSESVFWSANNRIYNSVDESEISDSFLQRSIETRQLQKQDSRLDSDSSSNTCTRSRYDTSHIN